MDQLIDIVRRLEEEQKAKRAQLPSGPPAPSRASQLELPLWADGTRGLPNQFARSSLFTVGYRRTRREQCKDKIVQVYEKEVTISYTGEELRQDDEDVFLQAIHLARGKSGLELDEHPIIFTPYAFLKAIHWPTTGQNHYRRLEACINRLNVTGLKITVANKFTYSGSLIRKLVKGHNGRREWAVWLEAEIVRLFAHDNYSRLEWEQRLRLKRPVAKWLHGFLASHHQPYGLLVKTYWNLCGTSSRTLAHFRSTLVDALDELKEVGFLLEAEIVPGAEKGSERVLVRRALAATTDSKAIARSVRRPLEAAKRRR